jgi:Lipopolysaccharide-assembly
MLSNYSQILFFRQMQKSALYSLCALLVSTFAACGIYKLNGASVEGKTINIRAIENKASIVYTLLSPTLSEKIRTRILTQTNLSQSTNGNPDYEINGTIIGYDIGVAAVQNQQAASQSKLTITVEINFVNNIDNKKSFKKNFVKFGTFPANKTLQDVERALTTEICSDIADALFNDAFVNW